MFFNKLCKKVLALGLATVLSASMMAVCDNGKNVASAAETEAINIFEEGKVEYNKLDEIYDLSYECFDENGYLKDAEMSTLLTTLYKGETLIEAGYDLTLPNQVADNIVDIETDAIKKRGAAYVINVLRVGEDGRVKILKGEKNEIEISIVRESEDTGKFIIKGKGEYTGEYAININAYDDVITATYSNTSLAKYCVSKLYEEYKAVEFSLTKDGEYSDIVNFVNNNKNNMIDAKDYDIYFKSLYNKDNIGKAKLIVGKYRIQDSEIVWNTKPNTKFEYTGKAQAPKVNKIQLSKSARLVGASDITDGFMYISVTVKNGIRSYATDGCVNVGKYATRVFIDKKYQNYIIPYKKYDKKTVSGYLPFEIVKAKTSIAKAKVTFKKATYNKANQKAKVDKVVLGNKTLKEGTDYTVENVTKKNAGTYKVKITGKGNYKGTVTGNFVIARKSLLKCRDIKAAYMIADGNTILTVKKDFKPIKQNNKYYLVGIGNYTGKRQVTTVLKRAKKK